MEAVKDFPRTKRILTYDVPDGHLKGDGVTLALLVERLIELRDRHSPDAYLDIQIDYDDDDVNLQVIDFRDETDEEYRLRAQRKLERDRRQAEREKAKAESIKRVIDHPPMLRLPRTESEWTER